MIKFKTLKLTNFMSYGAIPTVIQLDNPGTTLLLGEDLDASSSGRGSNGVGKTSILNALVYALYDRPLSEDITKDELVNHTNKKGMEVVIEFEKDNKNYTIVRQRKMKVGAAGNITTLYEDGVDITLDSSNNTNDHIARILGMPYDLFIRIVAFSATQTPFLNLPVRSPSQANQTDFIEELFDLKTLSQKAESLKLDIKETEASIKTHLERIELMRSEHERHTKQLESAKKRVVAWEQTNTTEIEDVTHKISKLEGVNVEEQRSIYDELQALKEQKSIALGDHSSHIAKYKEQQKLVNNLTTELAHLNKGECPRCLQKYQDKNLHKLHAELETAKIELCNLQIIETKLRTALDESTKNWMEVSKKLQFKTLEELLNCKNRIEQLQTKLQELKAAQNPHIETLMELESVQLEQIDMSKVNELKTLLDHQTFLLKLLTKKDSFVRKALLNKNIPFLNQRLKKYLTDMDLPHQVEFTHEMTASITRFGTPMGFGNLSNGQKARINIALSFAFRDVLQSMHQFVNICMLDEVLDVGLDPVGVQAAARMLKRKARDEKLSLYIISHRDEVDSAFDRKMIVQMSEGFSSIRYEDG